MGWEGWWAGGWIYREYVPGVLLYLQVIRTWLLVTYKGVDEELRGRLNNRSKRVGVAEDYDFSRQSDCWLVLTIMTTHSRSARSWKHDRGVFSRICQFRWFSSCSENSYFLWMLRLLLSNMFGELMKALGRSKRNFKAGDRERLLRPIKVNGYGLWTLVTKNYNYEYSCLQKL